MRIQTEPTLEFATMGNITRLTFTSDVDGGQDWALFRPGGRVCVVMLHGHGSRGDQLLTRADIRDAWFPIFRDSGAAILMPDLRGNHWMGPTAAADLHALLAWCRNEYDIKHFVLFSGSMGGTSNLIYSVLHPEDVSAVGALCPATDLTRYVAWCGTTDANHPESVRTEAIRTEIRNAILASYGAPESNDATYEMHSACRQAHRLTMPAFIVHGDADPLIPVSESRALMAILGNRSNVTYREMPGGSHDAPLWHPDALAWLVNQLTRCMADAACCDSPCREHSQR